MRQLRMIFKKSKKIQDKCYYFKETFLDIYKFWNPKKVYRSRLHAPSMLQMTVRFDYFSVLNLQIQYRFWFRFDTLQIAS